MIIVLLFMVIMLFMLTMLNMLTMLFFMVIMVSTSDQADSRLGQSESLPFMYPPHFPYLYFLMKIFVNQ
jgi:hypothetical protein